MYNCALPYYSSITAIWFGIIQCVCDWSFLPFNNHGSTEILENSEVNEHVHYPIISPATNAIEHTVFNMRNLESKHNTLYSKSMKAN